MIASAPCYCPVPGGAPPCPRHGEFGREIEDVLYPSPEAVEARRAAEFDRVLIFLHERRVRLERVFDKAGHERESVCRGGTNERLLREAYATALNQKEQQA